MSLGTHLSFAPGQMAQSFPIHERPLAKLPVRLLPSMAVNPQTCVTETETAVLSCYRLGTSIPARVADHTSDAGTFENACIDGSFSTEFDFRCLMLCQGDYTVMASVREETLNHNFQHYQLHEAFSIDVSSSQVWWGLAGLPFDEVFIRKEE